MGFTDINVKNIRPTSDANSALILGDFTRGSSIPTEVRNVAELDARFGTGTTNGYNTAKALLEKNIALRVARYDIANSTTKSLGFPNPNDVPEVSSTVLANTVEVAIDSVSCDDGVANLVEASYTSITVNATAEMSFVAVRKIWDSKLRLYFIPPQTISINQTITIEAISGSYPNLNSLVGLEGNFETSGQAVVNGVTYGTFDVFFGINELSNFNPPSTLVISSTGVLSSPIAGGSVMYITIPENLSGKLQVGDTLSLSSTLDGLNNGEVTLNEVSIVGSATILRTSPQFTGAATEASNTTDGVITYRDRSIVPSITVIGDIRPLLTVSGTQTIILNNQTFTYTAVDFTSGKTTLTLPNSANNYLSSVYVEVLLFTLHTKTIVSIPTADLAGLSLGNIAYRRVDTQAVMPTSIEGSYTVSTNTYIKLSAVVDTVAGEELPILFQSQASYFFITTTGKGDYADISLEVTAIQGNRVLVKVFKLNSLIDSVIMPKIITATSLSEFNNSMSLVRMSQDTVGLVFPDFYSSSFGYEAQLYATLGEKNSALAASKLYSDKFSIAIVEDSNMDLTPYKNDGRVTLFMSLSNYTLLNASAVANTINDYYNLQLIYGRINGNDILIDAIVAYTAKERINPNHPYTRKEYDSVGMGGTLQDTTYFDYATVEELARLGLVTIYTEYGVGSEMRLTNNVTPFADAPLSRHNVASTVQNIAKFMSDMAYAAKDFNLDFTLVRSFNSQVFAFLATIDALESFTIYDDAAAGSVATLTYNNATDFRAGRYKMGLDLLFKGTLVKFTVNFTVR